MSQRKEQPKETKRGKYRQLNGKVPPDFLIDFYDAWLRCDAPGKIAESLNISSANVMLQWIERYPELKMAKEMALNRRGGTQTFSGYIFKHLSKEAQAVWKEIQFWEESSSYENIETILSGQSKRIRQELFIHALVSSSFDVSEALRMVAIPRAAFIHWRDNDLEFRQLVEEIQWHKKNFFEHALMDLVEARHPSAVLFVNRTVNADRGYTEKVEVHHSGSVGELNFEDLDLDLETRKKVLEAMRRKKQQQTLDVPANVVPVHEDAQLEDANEALG